MFTVKSLLKFRNNSRNVNDRPNESINENESIRDGLFYRSFMVSGLEGWYLEFGCFEGYSFNRAYKSFRLIMEEFQDSKWDAGIGSDQDKSDYKKHFETLWNDMRFVAFDSFEGIPESSSRVDHYYKVFSKGAYSCTEAKFTQNLRDAGFDLSKVIIVPGFFDKTLTSATAATIGLKTISVAHIDSDLYESARIALDFCTPYFRDGSIVIFDEWFQFRGNPFLGERRAFTEWQEKNSEWHVTEYTTSGPWSKAFILSRHPEV